MYKSLVFWIQSRRKKRSRRRTQVKSEGGSGHFAEIFILIFLKPNAARARNPETIFPE